jgi:carnitine 3-dehydrogenase
VADASPPRAVGLLGAGVIGAGWAARFLLHGVDVRVFDPDPGSEVHVRAAVENARRAYAALLTAPLPEPGTLTIAATPEEAARGAEFVQESVPEREELKRDLLAAAGSATAAGVVIASSTSGLLPSRLQDGVPHPERVVVGHPFHPVYLLPLVEVCGGADTSREAVERAEAVYRAVGMAPLRVRKEVDGFVADRLLEALWREALWLVADGVATVGEIDDAIRLGAGLRWSFMGTFLAYRIAGGDAGMRGFLEHFGPALEWPWTKLTDVPELTPGLIDRIASQSDAQAAGRSLADLERDRDDCLVAVLQALRSCGAGAGTVLAAHEERLRKA